MQHQFSTEVTTHPCAVCERRVRLHLLMCGDHWRLVPPAEQLAVYRTLGTVQRHAWTHPMGRNRAHRAYETARDAAIASARAALQPTKGA